MALPSPSPSSLSVTSDISSGTAKQRWALTSTLLPGECSYPPPPTSPPRHSFPPPGPALRVLYGCRKAVRRGIPVFGLLWTQQGHPSSTEYRTLIGTFGIRSTCDLPRFDKIVSISSSVQRLLLIYAHEGAHVSVAEHQRESTVGPPTGVLA